MNEQEIKNIQNFAAEVGPRTQAVVFMIIDANNTPQMILCGNNHAISHAIMNINWYAKDALAAAMLKKG